MNDNNTTLADQEYRPKWENRRRTIFATLLFCAAVISYLTGWGEDTRLAETIVMWAWITGGSVIAAYVFGACYEDVARIKRK